MFEFNDFFASVQFLAVLKDKKTVQLTNAKPFGYTPLVKSLNPSFSFLINRKTEKLTTLNLHKAVPYPPTVAAKFLKFKVAKIDLKGQLYLDFVEIVD